jgi:uncharacterized protein
MGDYIMTGTSEGGKKAAATRGHDSLSAAGKRGNQLRSRQSRIEGGKKAAATRGHDSLSAAGRKGGLHSHSDIREQGQ